MYSILFVCMGNICRSPSAEAVARAAVDEAGLDAVVAIDSAGTIAYHVGERPDARMRQAASRRGLRLEGHARQVRADDFDRFDLVVAMDRENLDALHPLAHGRRAELRLFSDFLPPARPRDVPDPYYGGADGFDTVLDLLEEGTPALLQHVRAALDAS